MRAGIVLVYFLMPSLTISLAAQSTNTSQQEGFNMVAFGTGQTTGHIATLTVKNNTAEEVMVAAQSFLLPALQTYQSYVGRIPAGIRISAGASVEIAITGFCIDVHSPPVPLGRALLPVKDWMPVVTKDASSSIGSATTILPGTPLPAFSASYIGFLKILPGFNAQPSDKKTAINITYPGSPTPIGGTLDKTTEMAKIAPMLVAMVEHIEAATPAVQENYPTPFQGDLLKEREAIIQQSVWIFMAHLRGTAYTQEDFAEKVEQEFQQRTGTLASGLPPAQQAKFTSGVDNFWTAFLATGTAAKVWQ
jgi:hypothetical protein